MFRNVQKEKEGGGCVGARRATKIGLKVEEVIAPKRESGKENWGEEV